MAEAHERVGRVLRFLSSGGMADEDPDVVAELLQSAHRLAELILNDSHASPEAQHAAREFMARLESDTFDRH
ncbi:MAG: hypothetical protein JOZ46_06885 [Candidatus Dormibacteraeota bacterium]|nr:hypothetical protein [Candidatus Dormibacteraeota bacterium]MBV9525522.1 hypothetical protein [Candidatus Dormibacteraeota bacterium]